MSIRGFTGKKRGLVSSEQHANGSNVVVSVRARNFDQLCNFAQETWDHHGLNVGGGGCNGSQLQSRACVSIVLVSAPLGK